ncbi:HlyD family efflux transporter periplasmic adaptor subunit [Patescibacteria group bacterium]|nr:HlyD family efflux transporter periplasmic adaptor subunit [Patescibacteria group bacterium]
MFILFHNPDTSTGVTTTVTQGPIEQLVSVSGTLNLINAATLTFPQSGIVQEILVTEGTLVKKGDVLAVLDTQKQEADRKDALAYLKIARADQEELLNGPSGEERALTELAVLNAKNNLERVIREQDELVENARRTLLSTDLVAVPAYANNTDTPPQISGIYTCEERVYSFKIESTGGGNYVYTLPELTRRQKAETASAQPFGTCGLFIQFDANTSYKNESWKVAIPNTRSSFYVTNLNAYKLAQEQRAIAIANAEEDLEQAEKEQTLENATPRTESLSRAAAGVTQAEARLATAEADIDERTLRAPFDGIISNVSLLVGEENTRGSITVASEGGFELKVRIPEIDVTKVSLNNDARIYLDTRPEEVLHATVTFISPLATEIDGVPYYEALLTLATTTDWLRGGMNADVDIITASAQNVLRIPERYIQKEAGVSYVFVPEGKNKKRVEVVPGFAGNDGFVEVQNLSVGTTLIAP